MFHYIILVFLLIHAIKSSFSVLKYHGHFYMLLSFYSVWLVSFFLQLPSSTLIIFNIDMTHLQGVQEPGIVSIACPVGTELSQLNHW